MHYSSAAEYIQGGGADNIECLVECIARGIRNWPVAEKRRARRPDVSDTGQYRLKTRQTGFMHRPINKFAVLHRIRR